MEENKVFTMPPIASQYILRSTNEEVEVIAFHRDEYGARSNNDWVIYIDSKGNEHIKEHLNIQLDFKSQNTDIWDKMLNVSKLTKYPTVMNNRIFEVAKELVVNKNISTIEAVDIAKTLVKRVGIKFN